MNLPAPIPVRPSAAGKRRSALLMRALGTKATSVWAQLSAKESAELAELMQDLPDDPDAEQQAVQSYVQTMQSRQASEPIQSDSVWARLSRHEGAEIVGLVQNESPQVIALILSRLTPEAAASTVRALPRALATDSLKRLLHLGDIHSGALLALELMLKNALAQLDATGRVGGHAQVARIFDRLDSPSEQALLSSLNSAEPGAGEKIRALMFTFDDLANLNPASLQTILGNVDRTVLTLALKGANDTVTDAFFKNITQRAGELLREDVAAIGPVRRKDIEAARAEVLTLARTLAKRGDILTGETSDDELIE